MTKQRKPSTGAAAVAPPPDLGPEGTCPNGCGLIWSGGPPTDLEFPLRCHKCGSSIDRWGIAHPQVES